MAVLEQLSRQTVRIGRSPQCEVRLDDSRVPSLAALVVHQGSGDLSFVPEVDGLCSVDGRPLAAGTIVPFDFRSSYVIATVELPVSHEALSLMTMSRGHLDYDAEQLTFGRDPKRCHIVMSSRGVSARHASVLLPQLRVVDHDSTSGTWLSGRRLDRETPSEVTPASVLAIGPLPLPVSLAQRLHAELALAGRAAAQGTQAMTLQTRATPARNKPKHKTVMGTVKMVAASEHTIGRRSDSDIVLDHAQVSGRHAKLVNLSGKLFLEDSGSELGTFVRGNRVKSGQRSRVEDGELLRFGPVTAKLHVQGDRVQLVVDDREGWAGKPLFEVEATGLCVDVADRDKPKVYKRLLDQVTFKALPGDLIALMGPSGSGKTTLLHALTGYIRPTAGSVLVNGQPLFEVFDLLRGSIGYVPQDDIVHAQLTVREAVRYSARFRLPPDYSAEEIEARVSTTLAQLGLDSVADLTIGKPEQKVLSGGQRKRVNIAMELVTDPVLLFLDEPTSGLAADDTTALVELLARLAADTGKTIIATIHQPAQDEYSRFNMALVLGHGGIPLYFGPTDSAYEFFESWRAPSERHGISTPRDMFAELGEREARIKQAMPDAPRHQIRRAVSEAFRTDYVNHPAVEQLRLEGREVGSAPSRAASLPRREAASGQLRLLLSRYLKVKRRDRVGTAILLLQAPLIGVLLAMVFGLQKPAIPYWCMGALEQLSDKSQLLQQESGEMLAAMRATNDQAPALFFLVVAAVWFGTSNAAREIVSERAIFRRERMVNLSVFNYVLSKFLVLGLFCILQCSVLLGVVFSSLELAGGAAAFATSLGMLIATSWCSVALGLLLSAVVSSSEAAMALTPIALIPQVVLGGLMVPVTTNPWLQWPMNFMPSRWGFEGVIISERLAVSNDAAWRIFVGEVRDSPPDFVADGHFYCALAQMQSWDLMGAWGFSGSSVLLAASVLAAMTLALLAVVMLLLGRSP